MSDYEIKALGGYIKTLVKRAKYLVKDKDAYEPPPDKSHVWANLWAVVEIAEDVLEDYAEDLA